MILSRSGQSRLRRDSNGSIPSTPAQPDEGARLAALNTALASLSDIFPDVRPEVFREMLGTFPEESRVQVIIETLMKHKAQWVKGRWKVHCNPAGSESSVSETRDREELPIKERFRTTAYKEAVKTAFYQEFRGLSHSAIKAVLAEHNHSYLEARIELLALASKSWRHTFASFLSRRKAISAQDPPFITWRVGADGEKQPVLSKTQSSELDDELLATFVEPLRMKCVKSREAADLKAAEDLNEEEAVGAQATYDCQCCFDTYSFERVLSCAASGHNICFECVRRTMSEALFGQSWSKAVDLDRVSLKCFAVGSRGSECSGYLQRIHVQQALATGLDTHDLWSKFEERAARGSIATALQPGTSQCPACLYAELHDLPEPTPRISSDTFTEILRLILAIFACLFEIVVSCITVVLGLWSQKAGQKTVQPQVAPQPMQGEKFICRNPSCGRISCLRCRASWVDIHSCSSSSRQALQAYIESCISDAIKRTCPQCSLSFVKSSGCNKLVCICGYSMCYVCRQDVGKEGYGHFCPHFRSQPGGACRECTRCDLYRTEDEDMVIQKAREKAISDWKRDRGEEQGTEELLEMLELEENGRKGKSSWRKKWWAT